MTAPVLGCIADDYTGATDLSSMLVRAGLRVVQFFSVTPNNTHLSEGLQDVDAFVIALKSRSIAPQAAIQQSLDALRLLQAIGASQFFFKYCSTFDSTASGNIGPVAEALVSALDVSDVWFCPSFPENGRTVYCGYLFVNGVPLHESGMRNHPLNPMTDSNLVRVLQAQSVRPVGLLSMVDLEDESDVGPNRDTDRNWIVDAISDDDLRRIAKLAKDHKLLTGGSAIGGHWATELFADSNRITKRIAESVNLETSPGFVAILAGSCSEATRSQTAAFSRCNPVLQLNVTAAATDAAAFAGTVACAVDWCLKHRQRAAALISSGWDETAVAEACEQVGQQRAADVTEALFAAIAAKLVEHGIRQFVVAGGETAGAVTNALQVDAVRIGKEIAPGVPWVHSLGSPSLSLALKSGNFGGHDFFNSLIDQELQP